MIGVTFELIKYTKLLALEGGFLTVRKFVGFRDLSSVVIRVGQERGAATL